jgi:hypothetical protein
MKGLDAKTSPDNMHRNGASVRRAAAPLSNKTGLFPNDTTTPPEKGRREKVGREAETRREAGRCVHE